MDFVDIIKLVVTGTIGSAGFAVLFGIKPKHVGFAAIGGAIATLGTVYHFSNDIRTFYIYIYYN